jgi:hypothetical protein
MTMKKNAITLQKANQNCLADPYENYIEVVRKECFGKAELTAIDRNDFLISSSNY